MGGLLIRVGGQGGGAPLLPSSRDVARAMARAVNKTALQARTAAVREVRAVGYNLKASTIRKALALRRANPKQPVATLKATGRPIPLAEYSAKQTRAGASVRVKNGRKTIKHAFVATMESGHTGVFMRVGKAHKRVTKNGKTYWSGLPIRELFGPAIPDAVGNEAVKKQLAHLVDSKFPAILDHEIKWAESKRK
ncbi:phage tail protein [Paraburkholderia adhaesiva]|uniref:phage tail protein n=1 Tax=Paraburkholderia adhaesiva TaxID=2883244 RepID=UPI001F473912|nr:phage tail protein [Paraburkholderia adhaesiva]